jgi:formiminotetrahydrofolate cyclodeaminase
MYAEQPLRHFLDRLCSKSPEPGGGSASALVGATAAGLAGMLAALTMNKKGYEEVSEEMKEIYEKASGLKEDLLVLLQKDTEAFDDAAKAFKLPKDTEEQKQHRAQAIQEGLEKASEVPIAIMDKCLEISRLASVVLEKGNRMAITDGGIAALFAEAAAVGAMINARINFSWMKDKTYVEKTEKKLVHILEEVKRTRDQAVNYTLEQLG